MTKRVHFLRFYRERSGWSDDRNAERDETQEKWKMASEQRTELPMMLGEAGGRR